MVTGILCHLNTLAKRPHKLMQACKNRLAKGGQTDLHFGLQVWPSQKINFTHTDDLQMNLNRPSLH